MRKISQSMPCAMTFFYFFFLKGWGLFFVKLNNTLYVIFLVILNRLIPKICILILPSSFTFLLQISCKNLVLDQNNNFYLIGLSILITCLLDNVRIV